MPVLIFINTFCRYNLSSYPFLELVPPEEEIDFVCDGLHDGFYASVKFNCQVIYIIITIIF